MVDVKGRILQVNTSDSGGGAERVAWSLFQGYRAMNGSAWMAVGRKATVDKDVFVLPNDAERGGWARFWLRAGRRLKPLQEDVPAAWYLRRLLAALGDPKRALDQARGIEDFHYPGTRRLLELTPEPPDIIHLHNLHGGYFDLRVLPQLSERLPLVMTLHDAWLLSGHCAHSFSCDRWLSGCGECPDLTIYPAILKDRTACNWKRKDEIFRSSRLHVSTPSRWLMNRVDPSILSRAVVESRVIPNGVDLDVFHPAEKRRVRASLGLPDDSWVLLFAARNNIWKNYSALQTAIGRLGARLMDDRVLFVCLGEEGEAERIGSAEIRFVPFLHRAEDVATYFQAADLYLHAASAEVWGLTITEALACGTPVVATAVGGIPEQIRHFGRSGRLSEFRAHNRGQATGILVAEDDAEAMADAVMSLLTDVAARRELGENAARDARERFGLRRMLQAYFDWYEEILASRPNGPPTAEKTSTLCRDERALPFTR